VLIASSYPTLEEIVKILSAHSDISVEIQGHTDSTASDAHNLDLSKRRAKTVMNYLKSKGIAASRMTAKGYGESRPMDTNATVKGRTNNRRVELKPL
jgi:outer membrane protein OmpA-like peptidoglycan-associated protein